MIRRTISVEEAGRLLGLGRGLAYEAARLGTIPAIRMGDRRLVVPLAKLAVLLGETPESLAHALDAPDVDVERRVHPSPDPLAAEPELEAIAS